MRSRDWAGLAVLAGAVLLLTGPAEAGVLSATIDLNYTYEQENLAGDVNASTTYNQKYEIRYETALTTAFDFLGAVSLELEDAWHSREPGTSKVGPTLELQAKGSQAAIRMVYEGVISTTDAFHETAETKTYSNSLSGELLMTPAYWPELKLNLKRQRDYEPLTAEGTTETLELSLKKDLAGLRLELSLKSSQDDDLLPERTTSRDDEWSGKATYKELLYGGTEFELAYEKTQSASTSETRGVFSGSEEVSKQLFKTRLKNSLALGPRLTLGLGWEYQLEQDLLVLDMDYTFSNKYQLDVRWDLMEWLKATAAVSRETDQTVNDVGVDDEGGLTDTIKGDIDLAPVPWLRVSAKAELKSDQSIVGNSGASVDRNQEEKYEANLKNKFGDFWDLTLSGTTSYKYEEGFLVSRESGLKGDLKLEFLGLAVLPSYGVTRPTSFEEGVEGPVSQSQTRDAKIKFEYKMQLHELISATFSHEYGVKIEDELDEVLNFERTLAFNEDTRIGVVIAELVRELKLSGEINRKASDTEEDTDPELIEVSYELKLDWKVDQITLSSSFKYNDKGDTFDDLSFNAKVGWKGERLDLSGEYQYDKIFADLIEEGRKLNLKLNYKF